MLRSSKTYRELKAGNAKEMYQHFHWLLRRDEDHVQSAYAVLYFNYDFEIDVVMRALNCAQKVVTRKKLGERRIITTAQRLHFRRVSICK